MQTKDTVQTEKTARTVGKQMLKFARSFLINFLARWAVEIVTDS
jgi:hypothetical protein